MKFGAGGSAFSLLGCLTVEHLILFMNRTVDMNTRTIGRAITTFTCLALMACVTTTVNAQSGARSVVPSVGSGTTQAIPAQSFGSGTTQVIPQQSFSSQAIPQQSFGSGTTQVIPQQSFGSGTTQVIPQQSFGSGTTQVIPQQSFSQPVYSAPVYSTPVGGSTWSSAPIQTYSAPIQSWGGGCSGGY